MPFRGALRRLEHQCHGTHRTSRAVLHGKRQADEQEVLAHQLIEIAELLDHADTLGIPGRVGRPPPFDRIVHADEIGTKEGNAAVHKPPGRLDRDIGAVHGETLLAPVHVRSRPDNAGGSGSDLPAGFQFRFLEIGNGDRLAVVPVAEIEQMTGQNQLFQGNLIDTQAIGIAMPGYIEMGAAVFRHEDHAAFHRHLPSGDFREIGVIVELKKRHLPADIGHVGIHRMAEINDLRNVR